MSITVDLDIAHVREHWMAWLALRHFLPARLVRALVDTVVREVSDNRIDLTELFEEVPPTSRISAEGWMIREVDRDGALDANLQLLVKSIAWQNDLRPWAYLSPQEAESAVGMEAVDSAIQMGTADLGLPAELLEPIQRQPGPVQPSFASYVEAFAAAQGAQRTQPADFWAATSGPMSGVPMPLRALMHKHFGDLCVDQDLWRHALEGYRRTDELLADWEPDDAWQDLRRVWYGMTVQSWATATEIAASDPGARDEALRRLSDRGALADAPVVEANRGCDAMNARVRAHGLDGSGDQRVVAMSAPLLHAEHTPSAALAAWLGGSYDDAHRYFWAVLRRQIALGAFTEANVTRKWFARCLFDRAIARPRGRDAAPAFELGVQLILESMRADVVATISWNEAVVDRHVDLKCVRRAIARAGAHENVRDRREVVAIALFRAWAEQIDPTHADVIVEMWCHLAELGRDFDASMDTAVDVGRASLEALVDFADRFGSLCEPLGPEVATAILARVRGDGVFWGISEAFKTAQAYAEVFDEQTLGELVSAALTVLAAEDPDIGRWPLSRAVLAFLTSPAVREHAARDPGSGREIVVQILRFGGEARAADMLFDLYAFDRAVLDDDRTREAVDGAVRGLRESVGTTGSTAVVGDICALLIAPNIVGPDAILDALDGLERVLESAKEARPSPGLAAAYEVLLLLADEREALDAAMGQELGRLSAKLKVLLERVLGVWAAAAERPSVLAAFALPPRERPDPILVHNWAFASTRFAQRLDRRDRMSAALDSAAAHVDLASGIAMAASTGARASPSDPIVLADLRVPDRATFYSTLGQRLAQLERSDPARQAEPCRVLVEQCLRFGPRELDVAVFLLAARLELHGWVREHGLHDYVRRLRDDRLLRETVGPIARLFQSPEGP